MSETYDYKGKEVYVEQGYYGNQQKGFELVSKATKSIVTTATLSVPEKISEDEVVVNDTNTDGALLRWLIKQNLVLSPTRYIEVNSIFAPVCSLSPKMLERYNQKEKA